MFGYIKPYRPELRIREDEEYRAVYCGLCKELGRSFGLFARMTLSYDFAFMAMFLSALDEDICPSYEKCSCIAHPFKKRCRCCENRAISLSAKAAMILTYYKLKDDMEDKGFLKKIAAALLLPFASSARKKALLSGREGEDIDKAAAEMMEQQKKLEAENCESSDMAAQPTAEFLENLIVLGGNEENERVLRRFGYLLGRYIYLCDALDDLEDDKKKGNYNPFIFSGEEGSENAKAVLFMTVAELGDDLELLELNGVDDATEHRSVVKARNEYEASLKSKEMELYAARHSRK